MGSKWREMLINYGQIVGDKSSRSSNSAFFTVDGDLDEKTNENLHLRRTLEVHFRPLFQRFVYGGEKIACHDLRRILRDPEYRNRLPPDKVHELADLADFNMGRAVTFEEFVRIVQGKTNEGSSFGSEDGLSGDSKRPLGRLTDALGVICRNTAQQVLVEDKLTKYKCLPPPFFMVAVSLAQIIVYIIHSQEVNTTADALRNTYPNGTTVNTYGCNMAMYHPSRRHEAWRFVTYCFLHPGYVDLILNVIIQLVLGIPLEIIFSTWRMLIVYFGGVIVGSLAQSVIDHYVGLTGAAGGAYAIMAAHMIGLWGNRKHLNDDLTEKKSKRILCSVTLRCILMFVIIIPQVIIALYRRWYFKDDHSGRIGITAHLGGLVTGFLLGQAFLKDFKRYPWQTGGGWLNLFLFLALIGGSVIFNIVYKGYPEEQYG